MPAPSSSEPNQIQPHFVLEPSRGWMSLQLKSIWAYRELLYFLVWRDVKVRYKQTFLGIAWAIFQPFLMMLIFSLFFWILGAVTFGRCSIPNFYLCRAASLATLCQFGFLI